MRQPIIYRCEDGYDPIDLLAYSADHFASSQLLLNQPRGFNYYDSAAHLAHLAIELLLKAVSLHLSGRFQGLHDLGDLLALARQDGFVFEMDGEVEGALYVVNLFQASRYPNPKVPVAVGTADRDTISRLWTALVEAIPDELRNAFEASPPVSKGGRVLMVRSDPPKR